MRYLLDTNILSELIRKRPNPHLLERLRSKSSRSLFTSCICVTELRYGSALRKDFELFWSKIEEEILSRVNILEFGVNESVIAGDLLASLQKRGRSVGMEDVLIASTALSHNCAMITGNVRHFLDMEGLTVENWLDPPR